MFKDKLKSLRLQNNYSLNELAEIYNRQFKGKLNKSTLSRYENGLQEPLFTVVINLATLFNVSIDYLTDYNQPTPNAKVVSVPTAENKYKRITDTLDTMNDEGVQEVENFAQFTAEKPQYKKHGEPEVLLRKEQA